MLPVPYAPFVPGEAVRIRRSVVVVRWYEYPRPVFSRLPANGFERERDKTRNLAFSPGVLCPQSRQFDGASCRPVTRDSIRAVSFKLVLLASYSAIRRMSLPAIANVAGVSSMLAFFSSSLHAEPISFRLSRTPFRSDDTGPSHL